MAKEKLSLEELFLNYTVHKDGTVIKNRNGARMSPQVRNGYLAMSFSVNNKVRRMMVHRLVAIVHVPNPNNYPDVNHLDCNKLNPDYTNLEWCTPEQNNEHAKINGLVKYGPKIHSQETVDAAIQMFLNNISSYDIGKALRLTSRAVSRIKGNYFCCNLKGRFTPKRVHVSSKISDDIIIRVTDLDKKNMSVNDICYLLNISYQKVWYILNVIPNLRRYSHLKLRPEVGQFKLNLL